VQQESRDRMSSRDLVEEEKEDLCSIDGMLRIVRIDANDSQNFERHDDSLSSHAGSSLLQPIEF